MIPSSFSSDIKGVLDAVGELVTVRPVDGDETVVKASVQTAAEVGLVNEVDQEAFVVFISALDLETQPRKFDRIYCRGKERTLDADAISVAANGTTFLWQCKVIG